MTENEMGDHNTSSDGSTRPYEERVVQSVLRRIAAAPPRQVSIETLVVARSVIDIATWRVPALAAAALIMCVSGLLISRTEVQPPQEVIASRSYELPAPVRRYLETGQVAPMEWLDTFGGNR